MGAITPGVVDDMITLVVGNQAHLLEVVAPVPTTTTRLNSERTKSGAQRDHKANAKVGAGVGCGILASGVGKGWWCCGLHRRLDSIARSAVLRHRCCPAHHRAFYRQGGGAFGIQLEHTAWGGLGLHVLSS